MHADTIRGTPLKLGKKFWSVALAICYLRPLPPPPQLTITSVASEETRIEALSLQVIVCHVAFESMLTRRAPSSSVSVRRLSFESTLQQLLLSLFSLLRIYDSKISFASVEVEAFCIHLGSPFTGLQFTLHQLGFRWKAGGMINWSHCSASSKQVAGSTGVTIRVFGRL
jgi:hypothetical protein